MTPLSVQESFNREITQTLNEFNQINVKLLISIQTLIFQFSHSPPLRTLRLGDLCKNLISAREQLRACVKWHPVVHDFFIFSNFVRQYFRFRSVNFFQVFVDDYGQSDACIHQFFKTFCRWEKIKKQ